MRMQWLSALVLAAGLTPPLPAGDGLGEAKPYDAVSEGKPVPKAQIAHLGEGKPRFVEPIDYLDFVFLASDRPVRLRLHTRNNDKPYVTAWEGYMQRLFNYLDRNGDGTLDKAEIERAPTVQFLQYHLTGVIGFFAPQQKGQMAQFDTNKDGKVSSAEFREFYRKGGFGPIAFYSNVNRAETDLVTKTIYKTLDRNKDGKLSAEEMAQAPVALRRFDLDENEMLTAGELRPGGEDAIGFGRAIEFGNAAPNSDMGFLEIKPDAVDGLSRQVLRRYDKDKNGKLSRAECGLDKSLFDRLDANHDGQLDAKEFAAFFRGDIDLELIARVGQLEQKEGAVVTFLRKMGGPLQPLRAEIFNPAQRAMPLAGKVRRSDPSALGFSLGDANIGLSVADQQSGPYGQYPRYFYEQQFQQADTGKKGFLDRKQTMGTFYLGQLFDLVDRDSDGKMTKKEFTAYLDMQTEGTACRLQLTLTDEGRSLFELLDEDNDSRLSIRELRTAWSRIQSLAKSGDGLAKQDIPRRLDVSIGQAQRRFRVAPRRNAATNLAARLKGRPMWFQKMDRNQDGDISPQEFVGSEEDFRKLDTNGDGLISSEEAQQFGGQEKKKN